MSPCFGVDLGTSCSCIGWVVDGAPRLVSMEDGHLLPSVVWFREGGEAPIVGQQALNQVPVHPDRIVRSCKRAMGTDRRWIIDGEPRSAAMVSAEILRALADRAAQATGVRPERVVITVPAWFDQAQRGDTRQAAEIAGLELVRMINEPTAAALAHAHGQDVRRRAMVYDLGGGTFDVSIVDQDGPITEVRASRGDTRLGGDDIDRALAEMVLGRLSGLDRALHAVVEGSVPARVRLELAVEEAKRRLSESLRTTLRIPFLAEVGGRERHLEMELDRADLDAVVEPLLDRTLASVQGALDDAGLTPPEIDELLLVGGSTQLPQVHQALRDALGLEGSHAIPPREAVALGAAIQAAIVDGSRVDGILIDVAPWPLSLGALDGGFPGRLICSVITPRNAPLPSRHSTRLFASHPQQRTVSVPLFQGASPDPRHNVILADVRIEDLPEVPGDTLSRSIAVELRHDLDGMVEVTVTDEITGTKQTVTTAAGGEAKAELWAQLVEHAEEVGYAIGYGEADDDEPEDFVERASSDPAVQLGADETEARQTFDQVLAEADRLGDQAPEQREALVALARRGLAALEEGHDEAALEIYDELSDQLFAAGVYL